MNPYAKYVDQPQQGGNPYAKYVEDRKPDATARAVGRMGSAVSRMGTDIYDFFAGKQDKKFADIPAITEKDFIGAADPKTGKVDLSGASSMARGKMFAHDDARYHDVVKTMLGNRYRGTIKDENGFDIVEFIDLDGKPARRYINKPGMDYQDFDRFLSMAVPFVAGGAAGGAAVKAAGAGANLAARAAGQGVGAMGASVGSDLTARNMGATQDPATAGIDPTKAILAGALGGAAELVPLPILAGGMGGATGIATGDGSVEDTVVRGLTGALSGAAGGRMLQANAKLPKAKPVEAFPDASPSMRVAAERAGVKLEDLTPEQLREFSEYFPAATDMQEFGAAVRMNRFGLPSTKGQRTKDPELLSIEKDARYGGLGESAKRLLNEFDKDQQLQIESSAFSRGPSAGLRSGIGEMIAPERQTVSRLETPPAVLGADIRSGIGAVRAADEEAISKAWQGIEAIYPRQEAFETLGPLIDVRLGTRNVTPDQTPQAVSMRQTLLDFMSGKEAIRGSGLGDPSKRRMDLELVRRDLKESYDAAAASGNPKDIAAAKAYYRGFDDWVDDAVERGMIVGDPSNVAKIRTAREITKDVKQLWEPRKGKKLTAGGKIVQQALDENATPESLVNSMLGSAGPQTAPKTGTVEALKLLKEALTRQRPDKDLTAQGIRTWNDIRLAYWSRLVTNNKGEMHTPTFITGNIRKAFRNQPSLLQTLFDRQELATIRAYGKAMDDLAYKDPNPSGTAPTLRAAMRKEGAAMGTLKTALQTQAKRELFSKHNVMMSRIYQLLAKNLPKRLGSTAEGLGERAARRAVDQRLSVRPRPDEGALITPLIPPALEATGNSQ